MKLYKKIKSIFDNKSKQEKDKIIKYTIFLALTLLIGVFSRFFKIDFSNILSILSIISFTFLFIIIWVKAGISIFKSLFIAGASFSLIIFISQEYCRVPIEARMSDKSLEVFLAFGLLYVISVFVKSLYKELFGDKNSEDELTKKGAFKIFREVNNGKDSFFILLIFAIVFGTFLGQLFQVIYPIVNNICIYNK